MSFLQYFLHHCPSKLLLNIDPLYLYSLPCKLDAPLPNGLKYLARTSAPTGSVGRRRYRYGFEYRHNDPHMSPSIGVTRRRMNGCQDPREDAISRENACSVNYSLHSRSLLFSLGVLTPRRICICIRF